MSGPVLPAFTSEVRRTVADRPAKGAGQGTLPAPLWRGRLPGLTSPKGSGPHLKPSVRGPHLHPHSGCLLAQGSQPCSADLITAGQGPWMTARPGHSVPCNTRPGEPSMVQLWDGGERNQANREVSCLGTCEGCGQDMKGPTRLPHATVFP